MYTTSSFPGRRVLAGLLCGSLIFSGCATTHTSRSEKQATAIGATAGVATGAVIGKQIAGNTGMLVGAAVGGLIGAAMGKSWADRVAEARKEHQSAEERLTAMINASSRVHEELTKENKVLAERVERSKVSVKKLLEDYSAKKVTKEKLASEQKSLEERSKKAEAARTDLEKAIAGLEKALVEARAANLAAANTLEQSLAAQRKELATLQQLERELVELNSTLSV